MMFDTAKKWCGYSTVTSSHFDRTPACDRQTDGQTDILRQHSLRIRAKCHSKSLKMVPYTLSDLEWRSEIFNDLCDSCVYCCYSRP